MLGFGEDVRLSAQLGNEDILGIAYLFGSDVFVAASQLFHGVDVHAAFVGESRCTDVRRLGVGFQVRELIKIKRKVAQLAEVRGAMSRAPHLQKKTRQDGKEIGVARAFTVAIGRALHECRTGSDTCE